MTAPASIHPRTVDDLYPGALALADQLGEVPSRNRLMSELRIGAPKAIAIREALLGNPFRAEPEPAAAEPAGPDPAPEATEPQPAPVGDQAREDLAPQPSTDGHPDPEPPPAPASKRVRRPLAWPVLLLALPAFVSIWSGWVELGRLTGFGEVHPLPGIWDSVTLDTAITLPIGVETYAAYALYVWLSGRAAARARSFARASAIGSLLFGAAGQIAYHLMVAAGMTAAPWWITTIVACLPVVVVGLGAALYHLVRTGQEA